jgi:hypothetical protein
MQLRRLFLYAFILYFMLLSCSFYSAPALFFKAADRLCVERSGCCIFSCRAMLWLKVRKSARGRGWRGADEPFFGTGASLRRRWFKMDDSLVAPVDYKVCV